MLGNKHILYFHLRLKGKNKNEVQNWRLAGNLPGYTVMQNLGSKVKILSNQVYIGSNFDNLYFHKKY